MELADQLILLLHDFSEVNNDPSKEIKETSEMNELTLIELTLCKSSISTHQHLHPYSPLHEHQLHRRLKSTLSTTRSVVKFFRIKGG